MREAQWRIPVVSWCCHLCGRTRVIRLCSCCINCQNGKSKSRRRRSSANNVINIKQHLKLSIYFPNDLEKNMYPSRPSFLVHPNLVVGPKQRHSFVFLLWPKFHRKVILFSAASSSSFCSVQHFLARGQNQFHLCVFQFVWMVSRPTLF